eukprot:TRINITY_DN103647_c0_g1_i1.p1 TRINITY_DN103647_c0_g1~~TRINITY_DN103647_c0_g1_i1.p1  ORF type:complete len:196 (+),score=15.43 TRINITY_DN103647_c0_g1_i1:26-589(+)
MPDLIVALGSMNAGKAAACRQSFDRWPKFKDSITLKSVHVPTGVSEQPMGLEETIEGAKTRSKRAAEAVEGASWGIGLESGVVVTNGVHLDVCVCGIYDGTTTHIGVSSGFVLPPTVASTLLEKGYNPSFAAAGIPPNDTGDGVLGQLSGGVVTRPSQMAQSVDMALVQLANPQLYKPDEQGKPAGN